MRTPKPWLNVKTPGYFTEVLKSMLAFDADAERDGGVVVRFGLTGRGVRPNCQIESPAGVCPVRGDNHEMDGRARGGQYAEHEISREAFTYGLVRDLRARCLGMERREAGATSDEADDILLYVEGPEALEETRRHAGEDRRNLRAIRGGRAPG